MFSQAHYFASAQRGTGCEGQLSTAPSPETRKPRAGVVQLGVGMLQFQFNALSDLAVSKADLCLSLHLFSSSRGGGARHRNTQARPVLTGFEGTGRGESLLLYEV